MSETGREPAPRSARARLQESYRLAAQSARAQSARASSTRASSSPSSAASSPASSPASAPSLFASTSPTPSLFASTSSTPSARSSSSPRSTSSVRTARSTTELWPGQAAEEAAREAAQAQGAPPPGGYRPSAYQDQYLAGAALEPFVHPLHRLGAEPDPTSAALPGSSAAAFLSDRRVVDLGAGADRAETTGGAAGGAAADRGGVAAAPLFTRPGHQPVAGSIFAATEQHAATGSLFAGPEAPGGGMLAPPAGSRTATAEPVPAVRHDEVDDDVLPDGERPGGGRGRTVALVGGILAIVAAGAGAFAYSALGGGGPQPETVLPSTTVAFVKVDLDPSAGQKVNAVRFLRAFPQVRDQVSEKSDLREVALTALQRKGQLAGVDYDTQVAPWLGQRLALGVVPAASSQDEPVAVLALAVTDAEAARDHLPSLASALGGACQVVEEYAICTRGKDGGALDTVLAATARGSLADSATFRQDMKDLGEDGIIAGWVDSAKAADLAPSLPLMSGSGLESLALGGAVEDTGAAPASPASPAGAPYADAGRTAIALRFDGPHLELAGHTNGAKASFVGKEHVTGVTSLPWDSLAAVGIANGGDQLRAVWPELEKGLGDRPVAAMEDLLGIDVPEDLYAALGSQFTLVFGGVEERNGQLKAALVGDGDQIVLGKIATSGRAIGGEKLTLLPSPGRSVLATSDEYGQELVAGSGLGDMPGFQDAVKDVDDARAVVYVDIAGLVSQFKDDLDQEQTADLANLSALGITVSGEGTSADFRVRLTTK